MESRHIRNGDGVRPRPEDKVLVFVNGVPVGDLPWHRFEELRAEVRADRRVWVAQARAVLNACGRFLRDYLQITTQAGVFLPILLALVDPELVAAWISELSRSPIAVRQLATAFVVLCLLCLVASGSALLMVTAFGRDLGTLNEFSRELAKRLRFHFDVPADGTVYWRLEQPWHVLGSAPR